MDLTGTMERAEKKVVVERVREKVDGEMREQFLKGTRGRNMALQEEMCV